MRADFEREMRGCSSETREAPNSKEKPKPEH
jgi:hypothetical protein